MITRWQRASGLAAVCALHAVILNGLWNQRLMVESGASAVLFAALITPSPPQPQVQPRVEPPRPVIPPKPKPHKHLVVKAPNRPHDVVKAPPPPPPPPAPKPQVASPPPAAAPKPVGPVNLSGDLALSCPSRMPPTYPSGSRRMRETGKVVLRVELGPDGRVTSARIATSSGFRRLDEAALSAVSGWRCTPPRHDGIPVSAVALQPFDFVLEGR